MGVHSFDKLGAKMGVHSFFWQRVRAVRHTKNMGAINGLQMLHIFTDFFFFLPLAIVDYGNGTMEKKLMKCLVSVIQWILYF